MKTYVIFTFLVLCVVEFRSTVGYPTGAGAGACDSMIPGHSVSASATAAPYSFTVTTTTGAAVTEYSSGQTLRMTITPNPGQTLKGFLLKVVQQGQDAAVGQFVDLSVLTMKTTCGAGLTHTDSQSNAWTGDSPLVVDWTAPNPGVGPIEIFATLVRVRTEFWVKVQPTGLTVLNQAVVALTSTLNTITVNWEASTVYETITIYNANSLVHQASYTSAGSHTIPGLNQGTQYSIRVDGTPTGGTATTLATKSKATKPEPPTFSVPTISDVTSNAITVRWSPPSGGVDTYEIMWEITNQGPQSGQTVSGLTTTTFTKDTLTPGEDYGFTLVAVKFGEKSEEAVLATNTRPISPVITETNAGSTSSIIVKWVPAAGSEQTSYRVTYQAVANNQVEACADTAATQCTIALDTNAYPPGTGFTIRVFAKKGSWFSDAALQNANTKPLPPNNLEVLGPTMTSISIQWSAPGGSMSNFEVSVDPSEGTALEPQSSNGVYTYTRNELSSGIMYTFTVVTKSGAESSDEKKLQAHTTPPQPVAPNAVSATIDSLTVAWSEPSGGNFEKYRLTIAGSSGTPNPSNTQLEFNKASQKEAVFTGLFPGGSYLVTIVTVVGTNPEVTSSSSQASFQTKPLKATNLRITSVTETSLIAEWNSPNMAQSAFTRYEISILSNVVQVASGSTLRAPFSSLQPGTLYTVNLITYSGAQPSETVTLEHYTKPNAPRNLRQTAVTTDTISVQWDEPDATSANFEYQITIIEEGSPSSTEKKATLTSSTKTHVFNTLAPAAQYNINLVSKVGSGVLTVASSATPIQIATLSRPVQSLQVSARTTSTVSFSWVAPAGITPDSYKVSIKKEGDQNVIQETTTTATTYERSTLVAGSTYEFTVKVVKFGVDGESSPISATLTPLPVTSITTKYTGTENVELEWVPPSAATGYDGFEITVLKTSDNSQAAKVSAGRGDTTAEIGGLQPGVGYKIQIVTSSNNQFSEVKETQVTTLPEGVTSVELASRTDTSISITWAASSAAAGYDVSISPNDANIALPARVQATAYTFNSLIPGKIYTVSLTVVSTAGTSSSAVTRQLQTHPSAVQNINSGTVTEDMIQVTWSKNQASLQDKFQIIYKRTGDDGNTNTQEVQATTSPSYAFDIRNLLSGYSYEIEVTAFSGALGGEKQFITITTVPRPVSNVVAIAARTTSITVTWAPNPDSFQTGFKVTYQGQTRQEIGSKTAAAAATSESFTGLFPGERYRVTVEAVSGSKTSTPQTQEVVTRPLGPTSVGVDPGSTTTNSFRIVWQYDTTRSRVTQWMVRYGVSGERATEKSIDPSKRDESFTLGQEDSGKTYTVEIIANSDGASSENAGRTEVTLKPRMTSQLAENVGETSHDTITLTYTASTGVFDNYLFTLVNGGTKTATRTKADPLRTVTFNDLEAGTAYTITAVTRSGSENSASTSIEIYTVPNEPKVTLNQASTSITVIITRPAGRVDFYRIQCIGPQCPGPMNVEDSNALVERKVEPLLPNTQYRFEVTAVVTLTSNRGEKASSAATNVATTEEGVPGPVKDLREVDVKPYEVTLRWDEPLAKNGQLTGYTVSFTASKDNSQSLSRGPLELEPTTTEYIVEKLTAGYTYTFEVRAKTSAGPGDRQTVEVTTPIRPPTLAIPEAAAKATAGSVEKDSITARFVDPFNQDNGRIVAYAVVVTTDPNDPDIQSGAYINTWAQAKNENKKSWLAFTPCATFFTDFGACSTTSKRKKRALNDVTDFTVGSENCDGKSDATYCNGPLEKSTPYYLGLRGITEDRQFADAPYSGPIKTKSGTNWLVIGLIIALIILLILLVAVILFILYKRGKICRSRFRRKQKEHIPTTRLTPVIRNSSHRRSGVQDTSRPIKIANFSDHMVKMAKDSDFKFSEEFEDLKHVGRDQPTVAAEIPVNRNKNRFTNILPYDATRVKLLPTDDEEGSDYINANYVPGFNSKREFVVCQGPLPSTRDDFWRMTWEQNCRAIVMLTKCVEKGREKCDHYWPVDSEPMFYGDLQVTILNETRCAEWVTTEFKIAKGEQFRRIKHFHFTAWPDFGTPEKPQSLIRFVRLVRSKVGPDGGPLIIHCSAGVGRSGTFCALDNLLYQVEDGAETVDIYGIVHEMRHHRVWMVQTEQQYICIHQCLLCILEGREDDISPYQGEDNEGFDGDSPIEDKRPNYGIGIGDKNDDDDEGITMEPN